MALKSPYFFAVGALTLEDGTDAGPYHPCGIWFPAPAPNGLGGHVFAVRRFRVKVTGTSTASLTANAAALQQACAIDETLYYRGSGSGDIFGCRIREATVVEDEVDLLGALSYERYVTVTLTTDPYWLAPWGDWTDARGAAFTAPGHFDIASAGGEVSALLDVHATFTDASTGIFVGTRVGPTVGYDYVDSGGTTDAGESIEYSPASSVSASDNIGVHAALAFIAYADAHDFVTVRSRVVTTGVSIASSVTADQPLSSAYGGESTLGAAVEVGTVVLPSCALPTGETGYTCKHGLLIEYPDNASPVEIAWVQRIPLDHGAVLARHAFGAGEGIYCDADAGTVFLADADGLGEPVDASIKQPLRAAAGDITRVVVGFTGAGDGSLATLKYRLRKRFLTATG